MSVSLIVAAAENNVIGKNNQLIWRLPADLKWFKELTMGHHILMGRKTFESIGKALPGRTTIIITSDRNYRAPGCLTASSIDEAIRLAAGDPEIFIIGGGSVYTQAMDKADTIYLTRIHHHFEGDTFFPAIDPSVWEIASQKDFKPDEKNPYSYSFITFRKKQNQH